MGGADAGEVASALVVQTLARALAGSTREAEAADRLHQAVQRAHSKVWKEGAEKGQRMGATLTAVYVEGDVAYVAEVGDSRAYLLRAGKIAQLTEDQSLVQRLLGKGVLSPEEAEQSELRNIILQAMGHQETVKVALGRLELRARDCLVLCSDGLTRYVNDDELRTTILSSHDLPTACEKLVAMANERGGEDNITVVLGGVGGDLPVPSMRGDAIEETWEVLQSFDG
jgi:serine/threonine protein phosphatase PrpC